MRIYKKFIKMIGDPLWKWVNIFLDTTPRQWGHKFKAIVIGCLPSSRSYGFSTMGASIFGHMLIFALLYLFEDPFAGATGHSGESESYVVEFVALSDGAEMQKIIPVLDPEDVIVVPTKKDEEKAKKLEKKLVQEEPEPVEEDEEEKRRQLRMAQLREKYSHLGMESGEGKVDNKGKKPGFRLSTQMIRDWVSEEESSEKDELYNQSELTEHIAGYEQQLQNCYERALLAESGLSGRVHFELEPARNGRVQKRKIAVEGVSQQRVENDLKFCLNAVIDQIHFPNKFQSIYGKTIQFYVLLARW